MSGGACHLVVQWFWENSWNASILIMLVLLVSWLFSKHLTVRARCLLWGVVVLKLVLPFRIAMPWGGFHLETITSYFWKSKPTQVSLPVPNLSQETAGYLQENLGSENAKPDLVTLTKPTKGQHSVDRNHLTTNSMQVSSWNWKVLLMWGWYAGVGYFLICLIYQRFVLNRMIADCTPVEDQYVQSLYAECLKLMPVPYAPRLLESSKLESPAVVGCQRPVLLLPKGLASIFSEKEMCHVFLHELAHIKRRDLWVTWGVAFLEVLYWFNPIVRLGMRRLISEREMACDALVLSNLGPTENVGYGRTILKLLEFLSRPATMPGLAGMLEEKQQIKRRMEMIVKHSIKARHPVLLTVLIGGLTVFAFTEVKSQNAGVALPADVSAPVTKELLVQ